MTRAPLPVRISAYPSTNLTVVDLDRGFVSCALECDAIRVAAAPGCRAMGSGKNARVTELLVEKLRRKTRPFWRSPTR